MLLMSQQLCCVRRRRDLIIICHVIPTRICTQFGVTVTVMGPRWHSGNLIFIQNYTTLRLGEVSVHCIYCCTMHKPHHLCIPMDLLTGKTYMFGNAIVWRILVGLHRVYPMKYIRFVVVISTVLVDWYDIFTHTFQSWLTDAVVKMVGPVSLKQPEGCR